MNLIKSNKYLNNTDLCRFIQEAPTQLARLFCLLIITIALAACGGGGGGGATSTPGPQAPAVLSSQDITDTISPTNITLTWAATQRATSYNISRSGGTGADLVDIQETGTTYIDTNVTAGTTYNYTISACNSVGCSAAAEYIVNYSVPPTPQNVKDSLNATTITLTWNATQRATSYKISRNNIELNASFTSTTYIDTDIT
ncbi:MAG: fibronectin type III domain-containing protein, partial [Candidatus Portiera sp.]|nr:fibronectin type III domain-containing protein [Portiera sp.]